MGTTPSHDEVGEDLLGLEIRWFIDGLGSLKLTAAAFWISRKHLLKHGQVAGGSCAQSIWAVVINADVSQ